MHMKKTGLMILGLACAVVSGKDVISSFDTGYTMMKVREVTDKNRSFIVGASYDGTVLARV